METLIERYERLVSEGVLTRDDAQEAVIPQFERIREELSKPVKKGLFRKKTEAPMGLYLWGGVGRGKSMLMDMFVEHPGRGARTRRVHFHAFMQEIHAAMHEVHGKTGVDDAHRFRLPLMSPVSVNLRCLAFDEMQITDITDAMIVGRLFEALFEAGVAVVTTSNRVPDDLYKDGLNRQLFLPFIDLLKERMIVHEMVSPTDYRQGRLAGTPSYFTPVNPDARSAIQEVWDDFTNGKGAPLTLVVNKRNVEIPAFHNGVARASFYDLCGRALGAADYLALAQAARVLVLEDIPLLGRSNYNEAKRFVTLIDALYEAKVRIICSAAAVPEYLYIEGEGTFEFERTASRLREMQSDGWGDDA